MICRLFIFIGICLASGAYACLWMNGTTIDGDFKRTLGISLAKRLEQSIKTTPQDRFDQLVKNRTKQFDLHDFSEREIEGIKSIIDMRYDEAIQIFQEIEQTHPGFYSTAANLGTAYELNGDLDAAYEWIGESIQRNAGAHMGTEWLHLAILEAKINLSKDSSVRVLDRILSLPDEISTGHQFEVMGEMRSIEGVRSAIEYQLGERMVFVKPPDPIIADLLYTLGLIEAHTVMVESGIKMFVLAETYGFADKELIRKQTKHFESIILYGKMRYWGMIGIGIVIFIWAIVFAVRKNWIKLSAKPRITE